MHNTHKHVHNTHTHIVANNKINTFNIFIYSILFRVCVPECMYVEHIHAEALRGVKQALYSMKRESQDGC